MLMLRNCYNIYMLVIMDLFFQAEDGIRDAQESRGLGDVYKRQVVIPRLGEKEHKKRANNSPLFGGADGI